MRKSDELQIPNIDILNDDDLVETTEVLANLTDYCVCLQVARKFRLQGNIKGALEFEKSCDDIYELLPDWLRW